MTDGVFADTKAECGLVATVLEHPECIFQVFGAGIRADSFQHPQHRAVFGAMQDLADAGRAITRYAVSQSDRIQPDAPWALNPLKQYADAAGGKAFLAAYIADVAKCDAARRIRAAGQCAVARIEAGDSPENVTDKVYADLAEASGGTIKIKTLADIREAKVAEWRAAKDRGYVGLPTLWPDLNRILGGHRKGMVNVLGGYRGEGKSTLARQMLTAVAMRGTACGLITMEDPDTVAAAGIVGNLTDFSVYHMDTGDYTDDIDELNERWKGVERLPMYISDQPHTITSLVNAMRYMVARFGAEMFVVDHIQYIVNQGRKESRNEEVMRYSNAICAATKTLNVHTLVLSQLSRDAEKESRKPRLSDLRDSGAIDQDARAVMLLYRDDQDNQHRLHIAKNNAGPRGLLKLERIDGRQRFECRGPCS